jgi:hypothetical protein
MSDASDSDEKEAPSKKRKAEEVAEPIVKKTKTEEPAAAEGIKNLFVGNMSWNIDEDWLRREFEGFGEIVGCRIITDRETGRAKGYVLKRLATLDLLLTSSDSVTLSSPRLPMPLRPRRRCTSTSLTAAS